MQTLPEGLELGYDIITCSIEEIYVLTWNHFNDGLSNQIEIIEHAWTNNMGRHIKICDDQKPALSKLFYKLREKWQNSNRHERTFLKKHSAWLTELLHIKIREAEDRGPSTSTTAGCCASEQFPDVCEQPKRKKTEQTRKVAAQEELTYAPQLSLRPCGQVDASKVMRDISLTSPNRGSKHKKASQAESTLSDDAALSIVVEHKFTKRFYQSMRKVAKENKCKLYPPYNHVQKAICQCCPSKISVTVTESSAEVQLQALLEHTAQRLLHFLKEGIATLSAENVKNMRLICKWGCDGSSGRSVYKHKFNADGRLDDSVFLSTFVPLQLLCESSDSGREIIIWKNPSPSSPRFCRPITLKFLDENGQIIVNEVNDVEQQIKSLVPFATVMNGMNISVRFELFYTTIDGIVCSAVSRTKSTIRCYLCGAASKNLNDIDEILRNENVETNLFFGISTLHLWIRFFECCLHLSYKLPMKKWQARSEEDKKIMAERKKNIQEAFRAQLGITVDHPKQGYGCTNDGKTARVFFENSRTSSAITGVSEEIITRFHVILQTISCGHEINGDDFRDYCILTARDFIELYGWYCMPLSVHQILIHGPEIMSSALLPLGLLSEEAQDAWYKGLRKYQEHFAQKLSKKDIMEEVFNHLMVISDPYISSIRPLPQKPRKLLSEETIGLLKPPKVRVETMEEVDISYSREASDSSETDSDSNVNDESDQD